MDRGGTRLYQQSHTVAARTNEVVAGLTVESLPEDNDSVTVTATDAEGQTDSVSVSVSGCLGQIIFYYRDHTELDATYAIC